MIKVALLIDEFFGGANTAFGGYGFLARKYICKYIPNKDIKIDVLLERKQGLIETECEIVDGINIYRLPENEDLAKKWLEEQDYSLYLSIEMTYPSYEIMKLVDKKKLLLWVQDPRPDSIWQEKRNSVSAIKDPCVTDVNIPFLVKKLAYANRVKFISQGHSLNNRAIELYDLPKKHPIKYLPNPIVLDMNYKFDLSKKKKQVIFLGRLEAQKRAWMFCEVAKRMPEYEFFVMGKFHRDEENNKIPLQQYLENAPSNLHFTGHLEGEEKEKLIRESRVLLNTSIWEGIPISWLEALQYGTTIVSCLDNENLPSKFGAYVGEILGDGYDKIDNFIPAIKELMEDDKKYSKKAKDAIRYVRKRHNVEKFKKDLRNVIKKEYKRIPVLFDKKALTKPLRNYLDVKITYACNYKCEYCYQADENGKRQVGMLSKKNAQNLVKFAKRLKEKYYITLAGGEPFVYPYLNYLGKELTKQGHIVNLITNFSAPFEKIETFIKLTKKNLGPFSISLHLSQHEDMNEVYEKLRKLDKLKKDLCLDFPILLTCVLTEENFEKLKEVDDYINKNFDFPLEIQRVYDRQGQYIVYNNEIEDFMQARGLDVPIEQANNIDFYGKLCWCGSKFFYIESNGEVRRCYTQQGYKQIYKLGSLEDYKKIKVFNVPMPCYSSDYGKCVCYKHFVRQKFYTNINPTEAQLREIETSIKNIDKCDLKYNYYRFLSNFAKGKLKEKILAKKNKYKGELNEK